MECFENEAKQFLFGVIKGERCGVSGTAVCINADERNAPLRITGCKTAKDGKIYDFSDENNTLCVEMHIETFKGVDAIRQSTKVHALQPFTLTHAACANISNVCFDVNGIKDRLGDGSIRVHYCISRWQGEGQWRTATPEDLGLYAATCHEWEKSWCRFESVSSWSTGTYYPLLIIEDTKRQESFFFEVECGHSWFMELYGSGGIGMQSLSVKMCGADEQLGFAKQMHAGDEYETCTCVYGVTKGGFEEAVRALTKYKRKSSFAACGAPLVYNDYMNCNWGNQSRETLLPLVDKAAELGAEIFCLDAGWHKDVGVWYPDEEKFGEQKLQGIFDYIREKGMKVGVWFEFESVPLHLAETLGTDDCFLFRNGSLVAPTRPLANMRSKKLVAHLNERVDALYDMGVRFIKNDHNNMELIGSTLYGESAAEGLAQNAQAFLAFIEDVTRRHPDLIIENCGSGAMRADNATLRRFNMQSTSDQENYLAYPSILAGSLALMPPEKAGIWCYPYPLAFNDRMHLHLSAKQIARFADGEETVFNVVSGFMGCMYVSGKVDQADAYNESLLKEGMTLYKQRREFIKNAYPVFPRGMIRLSDRSYHAVGLIDEAGENLLLAVWNLSDAGQSIALDLQKYGMKSCDILYPGNKQGVLHNYENGMLRITFSKGRSARLFALTELGQNRVI